VGDAKRDEIGAGDVRFTLDVMLTNK